LDDAETLLGEPFRCGGIWRLEGWARGRRGPGTQTGAEEQGKMWATEKYAESGCEPSEASANFFEKSFFQNVLDSYVYVWVAHAVSESGLPARKRFHLMLR